MGHQSFTRSSAQSRLIRSFTHEEFYTIGTRALIPIVFWNSEIYMADFLHLITATDLDGNIRTSWVIDVLGSGQDSLHAAASEIYASNQGLKKVFVYNTSGTLQRSWLVAQSPMQVWVDSGEVFLASNNDSIQVYSDTGVFQRSWSTGAGTVGVMVLNSEVYVMTTAGAEVYDGVGNLNRSFPVVSGSHLSNDGNDVLLSAGNSMMLFSTAGSQIAETTLASTLGVTFGDSLYFVTRGLSPNVNEYSIDPLHQVPVSAL